MKISGYGTINPTSIDTSEVRGVSGRVVIGKSDGAKNFCMRVFEIAPGGYTYKHRHDWEHEVFVHSGEGEVYGKGQWHPLKAGDAVFIPGGEEHQLRNEGRDVFVFVCLVPSSAPEL